MQRNDYDRKRYEIRMLKQNKEAKPRRTMTQDEEIKMLRGINEEIKILKELHATKIKESEAIADEIKNLSVSLGNDVP